MNSSDDELPEIPGTRFPWMNLEVTTQKDEDSGGFIAQPSVPQIR